MLGVDGHRDFVSLEDQQRIFNGNYRPVGLGPLGEKALGDGLSDLRDFDFYGHSGVLLAFDSQSVEISSASRTSSACCFLWMLDEPVAGLALGSRPTYFNG